ncbi:uncharacterized protein LOC130687511 isoform X1 [Daphnia carinata]|uniref:uncharacterized protein LOC130687511 isoform X1 n=1 Tax=Daphnia carinata TaxID=120202 RepID=UPI00257C39D8|nr:uncharacterized protein LOC130687511 isoform X1 [Daphnia carinata]
MIAFITIGFVVAFHVATTLATSKEVTLFPDSTEIRKQIAQVSCDGSYTFSFRASDGTFLIEHKDANGYVTGEFGYANRRVKLSDYISQISAARRSLGLHNIGRKECETHAKKDKALDAKKSNATAIAEDETLDIQTASLPVPEEKKTILIERPKFFKFGEAIFRSVSATSRSEKRLQTK